MDTKENKEMRIRERVHAFSFLLERMRIERIAYGTLLVLFLCKCL